MHRRSFNGGPVIDVGCHYLDLLRFITGAEPRRVYARGHVFGRGKPRLAGIEDLAIDAAVMTVEMTGGHLLQLNVNWGMPEGFPGSSDISVLGPSLLLRPQGVVAGTAGDHGRLVAQYAARQGIWDVPAISTASRIQEFALAILGRQPLSVTGQDGLVALATSLAALESIETGRIVDLPSSSEKRSLS
jgi:predicted dehydrogenase